MAVPVRYCIFWRVIDPLTVVRFWKATTRTAADESMNRLPRVCTNGRDIVVTRGLRYNRTLAPTRERLCSSILDNESK